MNATIIIKLIPTEEIVTVIPLLQKLNNSIPAPTLHARLNEMVGQGYKCVGLYADDQLIGICGLWILTKYYVGKHIEPDNMIILDDWRSQGLGKRLMAWVYDYAKSQGCVASELNCYLANTRAQAFWENEGYQKIAYHYKRPIEY